MNVSSSILFAPFIVHFAAFPITSSESICHIAGAGIINEKNND